MKFDMKTGFEFFLLMGEQNSARFFYLLLHGINAILNKFPDFNP